MPFWGMFCKLLPIGTDNFEGEAVVGSEFHYNEYCVLEDHSIHPAIPAESISGACRGIH
jgi:hypothetical protein